ncbi:MAG: small multi-drug export protein, partial [Candidatus Poseidoniaceae archaeon]|nr:small multi-drug export protein [Candidatus Poseidoniaceae archaeon]
DVRSEILRRLLEEFSLFSVFKPVQMTARAVGATASMDFETGIGVGVDDMDDRDIVDAGQGAGHVVSDYSTFFRDLHILSRVEDDVREILNKYFLTNPDVELLMATVVSDEDRLSVSVIYKPTMKLAIFRFKSRADSIEEEVKEKLHSELGEILGERKLYIRTRNNLEKFRKKSGAGRVERTSSDPDRIAAVARQGGIAGRMLQTKLFGDILSTVEYTANEKRDFINKWGFWGLIVFVWIPFMASGVLVGAMLGLLSRMKFMRVMLACLFGGTAASITWAYTAEGIVTIMHKYKLELMIPIAIIAFVGMAFLHMRSTKARRQAELFEDEMFNVFHEDVEEKYGITD